jgi:hypothetical protein
MNLENNIIETVHSAIGEAIKARLAIGYHDSPMNKMIDSVIVAREPAIRKLVEEAIDGALSGDLRTAIKDACAHKLARVLVSKMEGEIEKRAVELRQSPEFRAKVTLAIEQAVKGIV